uniref:Uncharacterized protein n=1 Tax=Anguilla anguilla TaxID=7936 RepID=A0A0E9SAI1_ANGAN
MNESTLLRSRLKYLELLKLSGWIQLDQF